MASNPVLEEGIGLPGSSSPVPHSNAAAGAATAAGAAADQDGVAIAGQPGSSGLGTEAGDEADATTGSEAASDSGDEAAANCYGRAHRSPRTRSRGPISVYTRANKNAALQLNRMMQYIGRKVSSIGSKYEQLADDGDNRIINGGQPMFGCFYVDPRSKANVVVNLMGAENLTDEVVGLVRDGLFAVGDLMRYKALGAQVETQVSSSMATGRQLAESHDALLLIIYIGLLLESEP
jgi:hypothetical protein